MKAISRTTTCVSSPRHVTPSGDESAIGATPLMADEKHALKRIQSSRAAQKKPLSVKQLKDIRCFSSDRLDWKSLVATTYDEWWRDHLTDGERIMSYAQGAQCLGHERPSMVDRCVDLLHSQSRGFPRAPNGIDYTENARHELSIAIFRAGSAAQIAQSIPVMARHWAEQTDSNVIWQGSTASVAFITRSDLTPPDRDRIVHAWKRAADTSGDIRQWSNDQRLASYVLFSMGAHHPTGERWAESVVTGMAPAANNRLDEQGVALTYEDHQASQLFVAWCAQQADQDPRVIARNSAIMIGLTSLAFQSALPGREAASGSDEQDRACRLMAVITQQMSDQGSLT